MADFVAVLKKTIDGMGGETTPDTRARVYDKARATVEAKLAAINPPPPDAVADRQRRLLEDAIAQVESSYSAGSDSDPFSELENVFARGDDVEQREPSLAGSPQQYDNDEPAAEAVEPPMRRRRSYGGLIAALLVFAVIAGGGYAVWLNLDAFRGMLGMGGEIAATDPGSAEPAGTATGPVAADGPDSQKFTQRMTPEGVEVDEGPAGGAPTVGEGTSIATVTPPAGGAPAPLAGQEPAPDAATTDATQPGEAVAEAAAAAVPVGQKAIFYEERTNADQGSAESGGIVWSLIQQSPGGDMPPEPAIRAEARIPGKDIQLRMTISRNMDKTLPASHIIELIFLTPDSFEGGGIENILRFAMKDSEQAAGSPLIGIPAKIADGFFLVALNDTKAEIETNLRLLARERWIDVPLVYKNGRRALITLEKGVPGDQVFNEAMKAWQTASAAQPG
jgi:hypothetical protein